MTFLGLELVGRGKEINRGWILRGGEGLKRHGFSSENKIKRKARPGCACVANSLLVAGTVVSSVDSKFQFQTHVYEICQSAFYYIFNIRRIRNFLSFEAAKTD